MLNVLWIMIPVSVMKMKIKYKEIKKKRKVFMLCHSAETKLFLKIFADTGF